MKKVLLGFALLFGMFLIFGLTDHAYAATGEGTVSLDTYSTNQPQAAGTVKNDDLGINAAAVQYYPGTSVQVKAGDIIHNPKGKSTFFVGHTAIVGHDLQLRHSHPSGPRISDSLSSYINRYESGDKFTILRSPDSSAASAAATWSYNNINSVTAYGAAQLHSISTNYCSKFVWQAYYYGAHKELVGDMPYSPVTVPIGLVAVYPSDILNSPILVVKGVFYR